jgi:ankyrin repeat protein
MLSLFLILICYISSVLGNGSLDVVNFPTDVIGNIMSKLTFKKAYNMARTQKWNTGIPNPLDRDIANPLIFHNAALDNQFALLNLVKFSKSPNRANHLEKLLKNPTVDPSNNGNKAFIEACGAGKLDLVQVLIKDPRVDISDGHNRALRLAAGKDTSANSAYSEIFQMIVERLELNDQFLEAVSNGNQQLVVEMLKNPYVHPGIHQSEALSLALVGGYADIFRILINDPRVNLPRFAQRLARQAVIHNQPEILDIIFSKEIQGHSLDSLLLQAVLRGSPQMVEKLLRDPRTNPAFFKNQAIYIAVKNGDIEVFERLLQHPLVDPSDEDNRALFFASSNNDVHMVERLLRNDKVFKGSLKKSLEAAKILGNREVERLLSNAIKQKRQMKWEGRFQAIKRYWN